MDDLISRQAAIDEVNQVIADYIPLLVGATNAIPLECAKAIKNIPSAQKKGHWRNYEGTLTCSACETEFDNGIMEYCGDDVPMFCPNCGADMRGDEDD